MYSILTESNVASKDVFWNQSTLLGRITQRSNEMAKYTNDANNVVFGRPSATIVPVDINMVNRRKSGNVSSRVCPEKSIFQDFLI